MNRCAGGSSGRIPDREEFNVALPRPDLREPPLVVIVLPGNPLSALPFRPFSHYYDAEIGGNVLMVALAQHVSRSNSPGIASSRARPRPRMGKYPLVRRRLGVGAYPRSTLTTSGRRFYSPGIGRWVNRDAIEEDGGINLLEFAGNSGISGADPLGLSNVTLEPRSKEKEYAVAEVKCGGTIDELAKAIPLDPSDFTKWLHKNDPSDPALPTTVTDTLATTRKFKYPNMVHITFGFTYPLGVALWVLGGKYQTYYENKKYMVKYHKDVEEQNTGSTFANINS